MEGPQERRVEGLRGPLSTPLGPVVGGASRSGVREVALRLPRMGVRGVRRVVIRETSRPDPTPCGLFHGLPRSTGAFFLPLH